MSKFHKFISIKHLKPYVMKDSGHFSGSYEDCNTSEIYIRNNINRIMFKDDNIIIKDLPIIDDLFEVSKDQHDTFIFQPEDYIVLKSLTNISKINYELIQFKLYSLYDSINKANTEQAINWWAI